MAAAQGPGGRSRRTPKNPTVCNPKGVALGANAGFVILGSGNQYRGTLAVTPQSSRLYALTAAGYRRGSPDPIHEHA